MSEDGRLRVGGSDSTKVTVFNTGLKTFKKRKGSKAARIARGLKLLTQGRFAQGLVQTSSKLEDEHRADSHASAAEDKVLKFPLSMVYASLYANGNLKNLKRFFSTNNAESNVSNNRDPHPFVKRDFNKATGASAKQDLPREVLEIKEFAVQDHPPMETIFIDENKSTETALGQHAKGEHEEKVSQESDHAQTGDPKGPKVSPIDTLVKATGASAKQDLPREVLEIKEFAVQDHPPMETIFIDENKSTETALGQHAKGEHEEKVSQESDHAQTGDPKGPKVSPIDTLVKATGANAEQALQAEVSEIKACAVQDHPPMEKVFSVLEKLREYGTKPALGLGIVGITYFSPILWTAAPVIGVLDIFGKGFFSGKGFLGGIADSVTSLSVIQASSVLAVLTAASLCCGVVSGVGLGLTAFSLMKLYSWICPHLEKISSDYGSKANEKVCDFLDWCKEKVNTSPVGGAAKYQKGQFLETVKTQIFGGMSTGWERVRQMATQVFAPQQAQPVQLPIAQS